MPNTAYRSHRSRRCAAAGCVRGGRIIPGDLVFRRGHRYYHVADIAAALDAVARASRQAAASLQSMTGPIVSMSRAAMPMVDHLHLSSMVAARARERRA